MAKPRVFVSSTYYDLKHLRSSLENFIEMIGYDPILSEKGDIAYIPDAPLDESCYREVRNSDIYVLIIGGRYGSQASEGKTKPPKDFFERYDSITKFEYKSAAEQDIPIYILVEKSVYADYENFLRNKDNKNFSYAHVDSVNIFNLIEEILTQPRNNPIFQFDRYSEIETWLREQWAGLFRELLKRLSDQEQLASLSAQVSELAEINKTLKRYLEAVMSKVRPADSQKLIKSESERLKEICQMAELEKNRLIDYLRACQIPMNEIYRALSEESTLEGFLQHLQPFVQSEPVKNQMQMLLTVEKEPASSYFQQARISLGLEKPPTVRKKIIRIKRRKSSK